MDAVRGKKAQKKFGDQFSAYVGTIENGDDTPMKLNGLSVSCFCIEERSAEFGCGPNELALLVEWLPAGLEHGEWPTDGGYPKETGVNPDKIPARDTWVIFPKTFDGLPVYYKRGSMIFAA